MASCAFNPQISWFLFSDQNNPSYYPKNLIYNYLDINNFNKLASEKLGFPIEISDPYKLCDFKPTYGKIFEDFLNEYDYWGYSDIDIIYGNIHQFISDENLQSSEIISVYNGFLSGPFCLYRNNEKTKNLFRNCPDHIKIFQNTIHYAFDENIGRTNLKRFSLVKFIHFIKYASQNLLSRKKHSFIFPEFRYQFQWYFKRKTIIQNNPADMTEAVFEAVRKKEINASFSQLIFSDRFFSRIGRKKWTIRWESGKLTDIHTGKKLLAFHFPMSKGLENFTIELYDSGNKCFIISETGIKNG